MTKRISYDYRNGIKGTEMAMGKHEALADTRAILAGRREKAYHETQGTKHLSGDAVTNAWAD